MGTLRENGLIHWTLGASIVCFSALLLLLPPSVLAAGQVDAAADPALAEQLQQMEDEAQALLDDAQKEIDAAKTAKAQALIEAARKETAVPVKEYVAASPEEALVHDFIEWTIKLFSLGDEVELQLETNRNYTIVKQADSYKVLLDPFRFRFDHEASMDISPLVFICKPKGKDTLAVEVQVPGKWVIKEMDKPVSEITIKEQLISGVWDRSLQFFEQAKLQLDKVVIHETGAASDDQFAIEQIAIDTSLVAQENGQWQEVYQGSIKGITLVVEDESLAVSGIDLQGKLTGASFLSYMETRKAFFDALDNLDKAEELVDLRVFFTSLDTLLQLLESYDASLSITGMAFKGEETFGLDKMEFSSVINKDRKTGKLQMNGRGRISGLAMAELATPDNPQPFSMSVEDLSFVDQAGSRAIPPTFFANMYTVVEKGAGMEDEQALEDYIGAEGLDISKQLLELLESSSTDFTLENVTINNVMPEPITLASAKAGGDYSAGSSQGSSINIRLGFTDFKGMDMIGSFVPHAAALNFGLANIPSLLALISDPGAIMNGDTEQLQGQLMMNGMGALLSSSLAFSLKDSFVAFSESRLNLDMTAAVDNAARFLSTGSMKIALENPEAFARMLQEAGADQDVLQLLAAGTAMANRVDEGGKMVDRIDAKVDQEGKIFVNNKDVTMMFFPGQAAGAGQPADGDAGQAPAQ
jgi:hypothetical protein